MSRLSGVWTLFPERSRTLTAFILGSLILGITLYLYQMQPVAPELILFGLGCFSGFWWLLLGCTGPMQVLCGYSLGLPNLSRYLLHFMLVQVLLSILLPAGILRLCFPELDALRLFSAAIFGAGLGFLLSSLSAAIWLLIWSITQLIAHTLDLNVEALWSGKPLIWLTVGAVCFLLAGLAWVLYITCLSSPLPAWLMPIGASDLRRSFKPSVHPSERIQPIQKSSPSALATSLGPIWLSYGQVSVWSLSKKVLVGSALFSLFLLVSQWLSGNALNLVIGGAGPLLLLTSDPYPFALVSMYGAHSHQRAELMTLPNLTPQDLWGQQMLSILTTLQIRRCLILISVVTLLAANSTLPEPWWHWWLQVVLIAPVLNVALALLIVRGVLGWRSLVAVQLTLGLSLAPSLISASGTLPPAAVVISYWILGGVALAFVVWLSIWLRKQERWPLG